MFVETVKILLRKIHSLFQQHIYTHTHIQTQKRKTLVFIVASSWQSLSCNILFVAYIQQHSKGICNPGASGNNTRAPARTFIHTK